jgi:transcriptional regulator with XRE-family HTH domain
VFAAELARRRSAAGLSLGRLAESTHVNWSYLYRVETGERWPTEPVARLLDDALHAGRSLLRLWEIGEAARQDASSNARSVATSLRDSHALDALLADVPLGEAVTAAQNGAAPRHDPRCRVPLRGAGVRHAGLRLGDRAEAHRALNAAEDAADHARNAFRGTF